MQTAADKAISLTDYIFKLPRIGQMIGIALISSLFVSVSIAITDFWAKGIAIAPGALLVNLALSFILTTIFSFLVSFKSKRMKFKHVLATYIFSNIVLSIFLLLSYFGIELVAVGVGLLFILWFLIARLVFGQVYKAPILSCLYFIFQIPLMPLFSSNLLLFVIYSLISSIIFLVGLFVIFWLINAPVKRIFGVTGISLVSMFFAQWFRGTKELEGIFAKFAENVKTYVDIICFRHKGKKKEQVTFIVPHLHYGPFGNLGGSAFPHLIAREVGAGVSKYDSTFVFHGTATHDFNPIKSSDVEKITEAARHAIKKMEFESKARIIHGKGDECAVNGLASGKFGVCMLTHAPKVTEDIEFSVGLALKNHAQKFIGNAVMIDAHNAETGELTHVESGSPLVFDYQKAITNAFHAKTKYAALEMGTFSFYPKLDTVGRAGIKISLFKTGKDNFCIILIDSNGITPGFRNRILAALRNEGIDAEVCTTDTHAVNMVRGVLNPIGSGMEVNDMELLIQQIIASVKIAKKHLSKVEFGAASEVIEIDVFGPKRAAELVGTANSIAAVLKWAAPAILLACGIISYALMRII